MRELSILLTFVFMATPFFGQVVLVTDFNAGPDNSFSSSNYQGISFGDKLILPLSSNEFGLEPGVVHNGELDIILDINEGASSSNPGFFTYFDDKVYFSAFDADNGGAIWSTDGTRDGTTMKFAHGGEANQRPRGLIIDDAGYLYYTAQNVLYRTDGQVLDTLFTGINFTRSSNQRADNYGLYRGNVVFVRTSGDFIELYVVDDGAVLLKGMSPALSRTGPVWGLSEVAEGLIFGMDVIPSFAPELGTYIYRESNNTIAKLPIAGDHARRILRFNQNYSITWVGGSGFYVTDGRQGLDLRIVNSSLVSMTQGSTFQHATVGDKLAFVATTGDFRPYYIYLTDGTTGGTVLVEEINSFRSNMLSKNKYAFIAAGTSNGFTPTIYQVNSEGGFSETLHSFSEQSLQSNSVQLVAVHDDKLFFTSNLDPAVGRELYYIELGLFSNTEEPASEFLFPEVIISSHTYELRSQQFEPYKLEIYSLTGQLIQSGVKTTNTTYDMSHLNGLYIFRFSKGEMTLSRKVFCPGNQ